MNNDRIYNFSAGPSVLPEEVLKRAADEMMNFGGCGMSVMEMSHRSKVYEGIIKGAEALLREMMCIPDDYEVLFLQGGASTQFAMLPMNLATGSGIVDIALTGVWAKRAYEEAALLAKANIVASSKDKTFSYIPEMPASCFSKDADYLHICWNNTIYGTHITEIPDCGTTPIVADMSSSILSEEVDVSKFGVIFAGAQKNMGPAGVTVVIIRKDLIGRHCADTPTMLRYDIHAENGSMYNTPPTYGIYVMKLVLEWLQAKGGIKAMNEINQRKAKAFYDYLDESAMFHATVVGKDRSLMNIPFVTGNEELDKKFVAAAESAGFKNLKGHRSVGGMRASIYNAMPEEGVYKLIEFMKAFEKNQ